MTSLRHALRLVVREPRRSLAAIVGVAIASALVTSVLLFGSASGSTVTRRALADLPVDAQVVVAPGADPAIALSMVRADPAVRVARAVDLAHFDAASAAKAGTSTSTSVGVLVGVDPGYSAGTGLFSVSSGTLAPGAVAISRDLASNLGVVPGDTVTFTLPGGATVALPVSGVASIAGADLLLGPVDAAHRAAGANSPVNVAVMDRASLDRLVLTRIPATAVPADPSMATSGGAVTPTPVFAADPAVRREIHVRLDHGQLPGDPVAAGAWLDTVRRRVERQGAGAFTWVDDARASLEPIATDLAWGQILFIFLALPGIALALALSRLAADATADATRRHAALLRARGASRRQLGFVFMGATVITAFAGSLVGAGAGLLVGVALAGGGLAAADLGSAVARSVVLAVVLTTALASLAAVLPLRTQLREEVASGRQELQRSRPALWRRLYLDIVALLAAIVIYVVAGGSGARPILGAEGNPTVTLALTSFVAPLLFWVGGTLLLLRVVEIALGRGRGLTGGLGRVLGPGGRFAGHSLRARSAAASRAIVVLALAVGFATSVLIFDATYVQQQRVDAQLTLGADLKAVPVMTTSVGAATTTAAGVVPSTPPGSAAIASTPALQPADLSTFQGPGVAGVTPFVDKVVYVGPEAQDLLAVDAATVASVAPLADSFFGGMSAAGAMDALRARPDAILVSAETAKDYSMVPGDRVRIRVPDAMGALRTVDFTMAGVVLEFPTAPKDAFLVANAGYVAARTGDARISAVLARADGDPGSAARALVRRLGPGWQVTDIGTTTARLANGITSVDLSGLVVIDLAFAVLIAGVGVVLFLLAGLAERRREIATLVAIGAEPRQVRASIAGETLVVGAAGIAAGLTVGVVVGTILLQVLAGIFDPPADLPAVPAAAIVAMIAAVAGALVAGVMVADRGARRLHVVAELRER